MGTYDVDLALFPDLAGDNAAVVVEGTQAGDVFVTHTTGDVYFALSRRCTHRGCIVNPTTPTLNCPCHGSKYNLDGTVANGPAFRSLTSWAVSKAGEVLTIHFG
jgi:Rieske Fe-S protein